MIIIDDFISLQRQDEFEEMFLNEYFPWYYNASSVGGVSYNPTKLQKMLDETDKNILHNPQMVHTFWNGNVNSSSFEKVSSLLFDMPVKVKDLLKVKSNLKFKCGGLPTQYEMPHIDNDPLLPKDINTWTAIYYVCDSDGDTIIFNELYDDSIQNPLTVCKRISPKKGRLVLFNGKTLHSAGFPLKSSKRVVLNINFTSESACL